MRIVKIAEFPALLKEKTGVDSFRGLSQRAGLHPTYYTVWTRRLREGRKISSETIEKIWLEGTGWILNGTDIANQDPYVRFEKTCSAPMIDLSDVLLDVRKNLSRKISKDSSGDNVPIPEWNIQEYAGFHVGDYVLSTGRDYRGAMMRIVKIDNDPALPFKCEIPDLNAVIYKSAKTIQKI